MTCRRVIYDFGANNGDDLPYYLKKADLVVAVEANPVLCASMRRRFAKAVASARLVVENLAVTASDTAAPTCDFYLHRHHDVLGQFFDPGPDRRGDFDRISVPCRSIVRCIEQHGEPWYVKIDVQGYETALLESLLQHGIRPPFISVEVQGLEVVSLLAQAGCYDAFKVVDGATVSERYGDCRIVVGDRSERHSFPVHAAGPFGDDVEGPWMTADACRAVLARDGLHWKDVHATRRPGASDAAYPPAWLATLRRGSRCLRGWARACLSWCCRHG